MEDDSLRARLDEKDDAELREILRLRDPEEWQPEVFGIAESILLARGVPLEDDPGDGGGAAGAAPDLPPDDEDLVAVMFGPAGRAAACRAALVEAGIDSWLSADVEAARREAAPAEDGVAEEGADDETEGDELEAAADAGGGRPERSVAPLGLAEGQVVLVRASEAMAAGNVIAALRERAPEAVPEIDACPSCAGRNVEPIETVTGAGEEPAWRCPDCGHEWGQSLP